MSDDGSSENKRKALFSRLWAKPHVWWMVGIPIGGFLMFVAGIIFWGGFNTAIHLTNSLWFCTSCHEMETVYEEYKESPHYKNASGVRAICPDCHVPKEWGPMMAVKLRATINELPKKIMGTVNTPEKFEARRLELAKHVWKRMKETDSRECRNCHDFSYMELDLQDKSARKKHIPERVLEKGETCIDCHKGIAHELPEGY
jgi:nitrate/TMAO reductase-like tetraheme cytochrome c subunit